MSVSLVPEEWGVIGHGRDPDFSNPMVLVARRKTDHIQRVTVWKLVQHPNGWYNAGFFTSTKDCFIPDCEGRKKGVKLSTSRIDNILRDLAKGESHL